MEMYHPVLKVWAEVADTSEKHWRAVGWLLHKPTAKPKAKPVEKAEEKAEEKPVETVQESETP